MPDTNITVLTEFVSPEDPDIRRRLESKLREYEGRLRDIDEPWMKIAILEGRHQYERFRELLYKSYVINELIAAKPGEKVPLVRLFTGLGELGVEPNRSSFEEAVMNVYMRLTGELPLPD